MVRLINDVLEKVDESVEITNDGDHDRFQHYFHKKAISDNLMFGKPMVALCGKVVKTQVDPQGRTVCQTCSEILNERFKDGE